VKNTWRKEIFPIETCIYRIMHHYFFFGKRFLAILFVTGIFLCPLISCVEAFSAVRIEWGILDYPTDASYEKQINNEALMVFVFFGYDKISSGHFLIPNSPYFVGLFLGRDDEVNKPYTGRYFKKSGRFVCLGNPAPNETVVSEFDLVETFKTCFEKDDVPVISGIGLGTDTSGSGNNGRASAFIKRIEFLE
jgi:hypothetical protein